MESNVRSYCRSFTDTFARGKNSTLFADTGKSFIDFFAGAGALNYGHNNDYIKKKIVEYIEADGLSHGLDMYTSAKEEFLSTFSELILKPRQLDYKVQFCGPTGANAVEAALKLARRVKGRNTIFAFTGGFHGMSLGSLAASSNRYFREAAGTGLHDVVFMPFPAGFMDSIDTIEYMEKVLTDGHSGVEKPAAIIFETVQAEGGVNIAPIEWMQRLRDLCDRHDILLLCDEIQTGCGRTGPFLSFERAGITPDLVVLSKSISGYGLPMSIVLMKPEIDIWRPAEHTGTFRGNQLAFVGAVAALHYREEVQLEEEVQQKAKFIEEFLDKQVAPISEKIEIRGMGFLWGIDVSKTENRKLAGDITSLCYQNGLIIERVGRNDDVIKIMPPLTITMAELEEGCVILQQAIQKSFQDQALEVSV